MSQPPHARKVRSNRRQLGHTVGQGLLGLLIGGVSLAASILALHGEDADQVATVHFAAWVLPQTLAAIYITSGHSFGSASDPVSGLYALGVPGHLMAQPATASRSLAGNLARSYGLPTRLPTGDTWAIAAGTDPAREVVLFLGCARGPGAAIARCLELADALRQSGANAMAAPAADVTVDATAAGREFVRVALHRFT